MAYPRKRKNSACLLQCQISKRLLSTSRNYCKVLLYCRRLDLLTQALDEFRARGLNVDEINSKEDFVSNIQSAGVVDNTGRDTIAVVNIQKFSEESVAKKLTIM